MNTQNTNLASKQKRYLYWLENLEQIQDSGLKAKTVSTLEKFKTAIKEAWNGSGSSWKTLSDLERQLEDLNDRARLTVVPSTNKCCHRNTR